MCRGVCGRCMQARVFIADVTGINDDVTTHWNFQKQQVRERFFNGKRPKSATSLPTSSAKPPPRRKVPKSNMVNYEMVDGRQVATKLKVRYWDKRCRMMRWISLF